MFILMEKNKQIMVITFNLLSDLKIKVYLFSQMLIPHYVPFHACKKRKMFFTTIILDFVCKTFSFKNNWNFTDETALDLLIFSKYLNLIKLQCFFSNYKLYSREISLHFPLHIIFFNIHIITFQKKINN